MNMFKLVRLIKICHTSLLHVISIFVPPRFAFNVVCSIQKTIPRRRIGAPHTLCISKGYLIQEACCLIIKGIVISYMAIPITYIFKIFYEVLDSKYNVYMVSLHCIKST